MTDPTAAIATTGLARCFDRTWAVDGLDWEVPRGDIVGLVGPEGAGKTTVFNLLCGFLRPTLGDATVLGEPLSRVLHLRGRFGVSPQGARFYPDRSLVDSLRFLAELQGLSRTRASEEADRVLQATDLSEVARFPGAELPNERRRLFGIAQAFLGSPELVLLDDPTGGLDPRQTRSVCGMIRTLAGKATVVVSSRDLPAIADICARVAILDGGKLVAYDDLDEVRRGHASGGDSQTPGLVSSANISSRFGDGAEKTPDPGPGGPRSAPPPTPSSRWST